VEIFLLLLILVLALFIVRLSRRLRESDARWQGLAGRTHTLETERQELVARVQALEMQWKGLARRQASSPQPATTREERHLPQTEFAVAAITGEDVPTTLEPGRSRPPSPAPSVPPEAPVMPRISARVEEPAKAPAPLRVPPSKPEVPPELPGPAAPEYGVGQVISDLSQFSNSKLASTELWHEREQPELEPLVIPPRPVVPSLSTDTIRALEPGTHPSQPPKPVAPPPPTPPAPVRPVSARESGSRVKPRPVVEPPGHAAPPLITKPVRPPRPTLAARMKALLNLEEVLGTNYLAKLGAIFIVIGMAYYLGTKLPWQSRAFRVLLGYAISLLMLGCGMFFERRERYRVLACSGIGGGWALLFFMSYAMGHVAAVQVLQSQG